MSHKSAKPENQFNLVDEPWIPITGMGQVSLGRIFQDPSLQSVGGTPVQKIVLLKLLLAICQAAYTPKDDDAWNALGPEGLAKKTLAYLETHRDCFWLYGEKPFLQVPAIAVAAKQSFGAVIPDKATGNTTVLTQTQREQTLSDAEKAVLVVQLMSFALGGKKTDNSVVLSPGYQEKYNAKGKPSTGKPGSSIGFLGYLHNFLFGTTLMETLWLNILTTENIGQLKIYPEGLGPIPWETPPGGEDDAVARGLKNSIMGRLVPFSRFLLLAEDGIHYSGGILHPGHQSGMTDPSVASDASGKDIKVLWTDPAKRPWRSLTSLLGFLQNENKDHYFDCPYIRLGMSRGRKRLPVIGLWSAGLRVSSNAGEQYVSGTDDYVESEIFFESAAFGDWLYINLKNEMNILDELSRILYGRIMGYCKELKIDGKPFAEKASELFWQLCERKFQALVDACGIPDGKEAEKIRPYFLHCVRNVYETYCPRDTARQLQVWAANYPNLNRFAAAPEKGAAEVVNT
ncbi:MAG: type I-E CRISPR-associated protein Cse1/CasA [Treponema sp.]|jgi:CRISPR system Cascade subunit CasA|nr:type I-E CRISPR-associated protein Cse1/CasA [Treponema sp.]